MRPAKTKKFRAQILCCGHMDRGDDALGPLCAAALTERKIPAQVLAGDSSTFLEAWQSSERVIVVDAIVTGRAAPGTLHRWDAADVEFAPETARCSTHGMGLAHAIQLARVLKCLPETMVLIGLEAGDFEWAATLSPAVASAMPALVDAVAEEWRRATAQTSAACESSRSAAPRRPGGKAPPASPDSSGTRRRAK